MSDEPIHLPKLVGGDIEFGHTLEGSAGNGCMAAGRLLLREIDGLPLHANHDLRDYDPAPAWGGAGFRVVRGERFGCGIGRRYRPANGGCFYLDHAHYEACLPELCSAREHVASWHGIIRTTREALARANARLPKGKRIRVLFIGSDGYGNAFGAHNNFLITRRAWNSIFQQPPILRWLATFQVSSIIYTGQGKVGAENGAPPCDFQLAQRADFFECLKSLETTYRRGIVNSRDEPLGLRGARLHCIFFDVNLCHVAHYLRVGAMQIVLTMIEAGAVDHSLSLANPVTALRAFSHDPTLGATAELALGKKVTAIELQMLFCEAAAKFVADGRCQGLVQEAGRIVSLWTDTLAKLGRRDFAALAGRIDWILKRSLLEGALNGDPTLSWESPKMRLLDQGYGDLEDGMFWQCHKAGLIEHLVNDTEIERSIREPPADTRAFFRSRLLSLAPPETVDHVSWQQIVFRLPLGDGSWDLFHTVHLDDPLAFPGPDHPMHNARTLAEALAVIDQPIPVPVTPSIIHAN